MVTETEHELLTIREAAEVLRVSEVTISRWIKQGRLPALRVGPRAIRIRRDDLDKVVTPAPESADSDSTSVRTVYGLDLRPLTEEEIAQQLGALRAAQELSDRILARRGGIPFPDSTAEIIAEERRKRSEQLAGGSS
jgi:excisionase family DNA binding protein